MAPKRGPPKLVKQITPPHILRKYAHMLSRNIQPLQTPVSKYCEEAVGAKLIAEGSSKEDLAASVTICNSSCHCRMKQVEPSTSATTSVSTTTQANTSSEENRTPPHKIFVVTGSRKNPVKERMRMLITENKRLVKENAKQKGELNIIKSLRLEIKILRQEQNQYSKLLECKNALIYEMEKWKNKIDLEKRSYMKLMGVLQSYPDAYTRLNCLKTKFENFITTLETTATDQPGPSQINFPTVEKTLNTKEFIKTEIKREVESEEITLTNIKTENNTISKAPNVRNNSYAETDIIVIDD